MMTSAAKRPENSSPRSNRRVGGADLATTMTRLQEMMTVLEASQASFVRLSSLSLVRHAALNAEHEQRVFETMYAAIGIVILLVMVFGGFVITGGALGPVMEAIPHEMLIIGGAAVGALVAGNSLHELKAIGSVARQSVQGAASTTSRTISTPSR